MESKVPQYTYDAFISYRHNPRDKAIAKQLILLLETFRRKGCPKLHVFRDEEELPTSSDLSSSIHRALESSRFLILLCSPEYLESKWCREELIYFRKLHGGTNQNILPILVEGEPAEVFPQELFTDTVRLTQPDGTVIEEEREIEPLGADIRGSSLAASLKKLKATEYMRIVAPLVGKSFNDIYQREQRRIRRKAEYVAFGVAAAAAIAVGFLLWQLFQVKQAQLHEKTVYAQQLFDSGDRLRARAQSQGVLDDLWPMMDPDIRESAQQLQYLTSYLPQTGIYAHVTPKLTDNDVFFDTTGTVLVERTPAEIRKYDLNGDLISCFALDRRGVSIAAVSPTGTRAVFVAIGGSTGRCLELWDLEQDRSLGILLDCGEYSTVEGMQAIFSPDGSLVSACRIGGSCNANDYLLVYDAQTGRNIYCGSAELLGTYQEDGVTGCTAYDFRFLNNDVIRWVGGAYYVFFSVSQDAYCRVPISLGTSTVKNQIGSLALGRFALVEEGEELSVLDLAAEADKNRFEAMCTDLEQKLAPFQLYHDSYALIIGTDVVAPKSKLRRTGEEAPASYEIVSSVKAVNLLNPDQAIGVNGVGGLELTSWTPLTAENTAACYLYGEPKQGAGSILLRMDPDTCSYRILVLSEVYQNIAFLGTTEECDLFVAETPTDTLLLAILPDDSARTRSLDAKIASVVSSCRLGGTGKDARMVIEYRNDYCLASLADPLEQLDSGAYPCNTCAFSENGQYWVCCSGNEMYTERAGEVLSDYLPHGISMFGVADNGCYFAGNNQELRVYSADGAELAVIEQERVLKSDIYEIYYLCGAKLSRDGRQLVWLTLMDSFATSTDRRCAIHSLDLETMEQTAYEGTVYWQGDVPIDDVYDISDDGRQIAAFTVTEDSGGLTLWNIGAAKSADVSFQGVGLKGVNFSGAERLVVTDGESVCVYNIASSEIIIRVTARSPHYRLPELTPDGTLLCFGSNLDFWNIETGQLAGAISVQGAGSLQFSQDGRWFAMADSQGLNLYRAGDLSKLDQFLAEEWEIYYLDNEFMILGNGRHLYRWTFHSEAA